MLDTALLHHMRQSLAPAPDRCLPAAACSDQEDADADRLGGATLGGPHLWCLFWLCKLACKATVEFSSHAGSANGLQDSIEFTNL